MPLLYGSIQGTEIKVNLRDSPVWKVGRGSQNDIVLDDDMVSRHHALIQCMEGRYLLVDLGSRNGAFVNGRRVSVPVYLKDQDSVSFGGLQFTFLQATETTAAEQGRNQSERARSTDLLVAPKRISILVVDIRDFTGLAQRLDEAVLARTIGSWIRRGGNILQTEDSWAEKFIGDAIMGVWIHEKGSLDTSVIYHCFAALGQLVRVTQDLQSEFGLPDPIRIGAGLNTDLASVANLGSGDFADYTALGDGVNKAFRLESASRQVPCDLAMGQGTFECMGSIAGRLFEERKMPLKGYKEPCAVYATEFSSIPEIVRLLQRARA